MGYHIVLVRQRPIPWAELARAVRGLGREADAAARELRPTEGGALVVRVLHASRDEPRCKWTGDDERRHLVVPAAARRARARGDAFEAYRTVDDAYIQSDDQPVLDAARHTSAPSPARTLRRRMWDVLRVAVLVLLAVTFCARLTKG